MTKRMVSFLVIAALLLSLFGGTVWAGPGAPIVRVQSTTVPQGSTTWVAVTLDNNYGLTGAELAVHYDDTALTLVDAQNSDALASAGAQFTVPGVFADGCKFAWVIPDAFETRTADLLLLQFRAQAGAPAGVYPISVTVNKWYDSDLGLLSLVVENGSVRVTSTLLAGDVNSDGAVSIADVVCLMRSVVGGYDVAVSGTANVNGDREVDVLDAILIARYLAGGYDITLQLPPEDPNGSQGLAYHLSKDGTYYSVTGMGSCTDTDLVIPAYYNGKPVTAVGEGAFFLNETLQTVTLPAGMRTIGAHAFDICLSLKKVTFSTGLRVIGTQAFAYCPQLSAITLPEGLLTINHGAFDGTSVSEIVVPASVSFIEGSILSHNAALTVAAGNETYYDHGNCIIDRSTGTIVSGCTASTIPQDQTVTRIGNDAFANCIDLTTLNIPANIMSIGYTAFRNAHALQTVTLTRNLKAIGAHAFASCYNITDVYYTGTEEDWNNLVINEGNEDLINATIHFSLETPSDPDAKTVTLIANPDGTLSLPANTTVYVGDTLIVPRHELIYTGDFVNRSTGETENDVTVIANTFQVLRGEEKQGSCWGDALTFGVNPFGSDGWQEPTAAMATPGTYSFVLQEARNATWSSYYTVDIPLITFEVHAR